MQPKQRRHVGPQRARKQRQDGRASAPTAPALPKLTVPRPTRLYPRSRLFDLLDRARKDHRVNWVSAPGGAGNTSLAASYLSALKPPVLWYQVDAGDGDVARLYRYRRPAWIDEFERLSVDLPLPADPRIEAQVACAMFLALLYIKPWHEDMSKWAERVSMLVHQGSDEALCKQAGAMADEKLS